VFRVGKQICIYDPESSKQQFLTGRLKSVTTVLHSTISYSSRYISVCESVRHEKTGPGHAQASVFSLTTFSRQKTVTHACTGEFICSAFTGDAKYLVTLNDGHEYQLVIWQWEKERQYKSVSLQSKPNRMSVSPSQLQISVSGPGILKCFSVGQDGALKTSSLLNPSKECENFVDHKWLSQTDALHRMVAISATESVADGYRRQNVYVFEGPDSPPGTVGPPISLEFRQTVNPRFETPNASIEGLAVFSKGFCLYGKEGFVAIYEKCDDKREPYYEVRSMCLEVTNFIGGAVLPSEDRLILVSTEGRLVSVGIGQHDIPGEKESEVVAAVDLCPGGFHDSAIISSDVAYHRSLYATLSMDSALRIWNFETMKCELTHKFLQEDPIALAMHPSGFQIIVSFKEKVRLYNVYMDKIKLFQETASKSLKELRFSNSGQYWAAASTINVIVFDTKTFSQVMCFQGHMLAVRRIAWGPGDQVLFSAGADGNVYGWSLQYEHRLDVYSSNRSSGILGLAVDGFDSSLVGSSIERRNGRNFVEWGGDGSPESHVDPNCFIIGTNTVILTGQDMFMRLAEWIPIGHDGKSQARDDTGGQLVTLRVDDRLCITALIISQCKKFVYCGMSDGSLRIYDWPIKIDPPPYLETQAHSQAVVDIRESPTGHIILTVSEDASVFVHSVLKGQLAALSGGDGAMDLFSVSSSEFSGAVYNSGTVQIAKDDMEDHIQEVFDLKKKIEEMATKFAFEIHQNENTHADEVKRLLDRHNTAMNNEKEKFENMQSKMEAKIRDLMATLESKGLDHVRMTAELENRYEHKLADQLDRYDRLGEEMELLKQRCEGLLHAERQEFERQLNEIKNKSRRFEKKMFNEKKRLVDEKTNDENAFKEILDQQEDEYEDELRQLIAAAESELKSERENITKLRTLVQTKNTKLDQLKKKLTELASSAKARQAILLHERKERQKLQDTIEHYKKNLLEREEALAEKEKTILELRSTTRTLENFRFVLDHRLQQLSSERGPITQHIEGLEQHIRTMYEELVEEFENKKEESMKAEAKDLRISAFIHEVGLLRQDNRQKDIYIATFRRELENVIGAFGQKELESAVKQLYRKYVKGENVKMDFKTAAGVSAQDESGAVQFLLRGEDSDDDSDLGFSMTNDSPGTLKAGGGKVTGMVPGVMKGGKNMKKALLQEIESELIESAKEAHRQRQFVERSAENLQHRLRSTKQEASRINRARLNENSHLIFECNELRKEVKNLTRKLEIANQALLDAQAQQLVASVGVAQKDDMQSCKDWEMDITRSDNESDTTAHIRKAAAQSMKESGRSSREASAPPSTRRTNSGNSSARPGFDKKASASAVQLGDRANRVGDVKTDMHAQTSAPNLHSAGNSPPQRGSFAVSNSKTKRPGSAKDYAGSPIAHDYLKGAMTVEQRLLRKKDAQIEKLVKETEALTAQLDEASRERNMQRTELSRLRALLAKVMSQTPAGNLPQAHTTARSTARSTKENRLMIAVGMDNSVRVNHGKTHADITGHPSQHDLEVMGAYGQSTSLSKRHDDDSINTSKGSREQMRLPLGIDKTKVGGGMEPKE